MDVHFHYCCCQHINVMAQIKQAKFGSVDIDFVLGVGGYDLERYSCTIFPLKSCCFSLCSPPCNLVLYINILYIVSDPNVFFLILSHCLIKCLNVLELNLRFVEIVFILQAINMNLDMVPFLNLFFSLYIIFYFSKFLRVGCNISSEIFK